MNTTSYSTVRGTLVAGGVSVVGVLPMFLTGGLAVQMAEDLVFGSVGLGLAVGSFRLAAGIGSPFLGKVADRIGAIWSLRIAVIVSSLASAAVATLATSWTTLVACLMLAGSAMAIGQPAANRLISSSVAPERMGLAFGFKQSANPSASMLAGFSVPVIALTFGWRWAFWIAVVLGLVVLLLIPRRRLSRDAATRKRDASSGDFDRRTIALFFTAFALAMAVGTSVPTFYVAATVRAGTAEGLAGFFLAAASIGAILVRLLSGALCDRMASGHLRLFMAGLMSGVVGFVLLATQQPVPMAIGAVIALGGTWGFNGVFWYALIRAFPESPGHVTGVLLPGGQLGGVVGPVLLGFIVGLTSFTVAWLVTAGLSAVAAYAMMLGARRLAPPSVIAER